MADVSLGVKRTGDSQLSG